MSKLKKLRIPFAVLLISAGAYCQEKPNIAVHFNKSFYFNGDTAWFSVWVPDGIIEEQALAKVSVKGIDENILTTFSLMVRSNGGSNGFIAIPNNIPSGNYLFRMVLIDKITLETFMLITQQIIIFNDSEENSSIRYTSYKGPDNATWDERITLSTNSEIYHAREEIKLDIQIKDKQGKPIKGWLSMAVVESDSVLEGHDISFSYAEVSSDRKASDFIVINEKAHDKEKDKPIDQSNLLAFMNDTREIIQGTTDKYGRFIARIEPFTGQRTIQYWDYYGRDIEMITEDIFLTETSPEKNEVIESDDLKTYLKRNSIRKKMNYIFHMQSYQTSNDSIKVWQFPPDFSVETKNYEPFKDLKEFMETVITPLKIIRHKNELVAKMVNPQSKPYYSKEPVFIIDGVICSFLEVLELEMRHLTSIDFYNRAESLRRFGIMGENGIVVLRTTSFHPYHYDKQLKTIHGLQPSIIYPRHVNVNYNEKQPLLGSEIYWNPSLITDEYGQLRISFHHNDEPGNYEIIVICKLKNGDLAIAQKTYQVKL